MLTQTEMLALMARFRTAYAAGNRTELLAVTTDEFEWFQHAADEARQRPQGRILRGVDELLAELEWRKAHWHNVKYANLEERSAGDLLVQTFVISGDEDGSSFHAKAVDLYPVVDGRISRKDTYWKYVK